MNMNMKKIISSTIYSAVALAVLSACQDDKMGSLYPEGPDGHGKEITFTPSRGFEPDRDMGTASPAQGSRGREYAPHTVADVVLRHADGREGVTMRQEEADLGPVYFGGGENASRGVSVVTSTFQSNGFGVSCLMKEHGSTTNQFYLFRDINAKWNVGSNVYETYAKNAAGTEERSAFYWPGTTDYDLKFFGVYPKSWPVAGTVTVPTYNPITNTQSDEQQQVPGYTTCTSTTDRSVFNFNATGNAPPTIDYTAVGYDATNHPQWIREHQDILAAYTSDMAGNTFTSVAMPFYHITTRVGFFIGNIYKPATGDNTNATEETGYLTSLKITGVYKKGTYDMATGVFPAAADAPNSGWTVDTQAGIAEYIVVGKGGIYDSDKVVTGNNQTLRPYQYGFKVTQSGVRLTGTSTFMGMTEGIGDAQEGTSGSVTHDQETNPHYNCMFLIPQTLPEGARIEAEFVPVKFNDQGQALEDDGSMVTNMETFMANRTHETLSAEINGKVWKKGTRVYYYLQLGNQMYIDGLESPQDAHFTSEEIKFWAPANSGGWRLSAEAVTPPATGGEDAPADQWTPLNLSETQLASMISFRRAKVGFEKPQNGGYWIYRDQALVPDTTIQNQTGQMESFSTYMRYSWLSGPESETGQNITAYAFLAENAGFDTDDLDANGNTKPRYFRIKLTPVNTDKVGSHEYILKQLGVCWQTQKTQGLKPTYNPSDGTISSTSSYEYEFGCERLEEKKANYGFNQDQTVTYTWSPNSVEWGVWKDIREALQHNGGLFFHPSSGQGGGNPYIEMGYKMTSLIPNAVNPDDGVYNTYNLFNFSGSALSATDQMILDIRVKKGNTQVQAFDPPTGGIGGLMNMRNGTAALEALKKNGFAIGQRTQTVSNQTITVYEPTINFDDVRWFLPAINQYNGMTDTEHPLTANPQPQWSSTAIFAGANADPNTSRYAKSWNFPGGETSTLRTDSLSFRACRVKVNAIHSSATSNDLDGNLDPWVNPNNDTHFD